MIPVSGGSLRSDFRLGLGPGPFTPQRPSPERCLRLQGAEASRHYSGRGPPPRAGHSTGPIIGRHRWLSTTGRENGRQVDKECPLEGPAQYVHPLRGGGTGGSCVYAVSPGATAPSLHLWPLRRTAAIHSDAGGTRVAGRATRDVRSRGGALRFLQTGSAAPDALCRRSRIPGHCKGPGSRAEVPRAASLRTSPWGGTRPSGG